MPPFNIQIPSYDGKTFGAYVAKSALDHAPTLIVIQEIFGVNAGMRQMCDAWAAQGFHAICPDLFWRQKPGVEITDKTPAEWQEAMGYFQAFDTALGIKDLQSTLRIARTLPGSSGKVASIGFCLGGKLAYLMGAASDAECNVSYYGVGLGDLLGEIPQITKPMLMHFAELDKYLSGDALKTVQAAIARNSNIEGYVYPGADHAFARINGEHFNAQASRLAHERTLAFLKKHLG